MKLVNIIIVDSLQLVVSKVLLISWFAWTWGFSSYIFFADLVGESRYQGQPLGSQGCSHPLLKKIAKACKGCAKYDLDDPSAPLSVHIPFERREHDDREDWQKERMYGRLPYDQYARLVVI